MAQLNSAVGLIPCDPKLILNTNNKKTQIKNNSSVLLEIFYRALRGRAYHYVTAEHEFYMTHVTELLMLCLHS